VTVQLKRQQQAKSLAKRLALSFKSDPELWGNAIGGKIAQGLTPRMTCAILGLPYKAVGVDWMGFAHPIPAPTELLLAGQSPTNAA
jgi:hypothetical protein